MEEIQSGTKTADNPQGIGTNPTYDLGKHGQGIYVIPTWNSKGTKVKGYGTYGFDTVIEKATKLWQELIDARVLPVGVMSPPLERGTLTAYYTYQQILAIGSKHNVACGWRSSIELTPQLVGLEGKWVKVVDCYGEERTFKVGKSTGWMPCHLEIERANDDGGCSAMGAPYQSIEVVVKRR